MEPLSLILELNSKNDREMWYGVDGVSLTTVASAAELWKPNRDVVLLIACHNYTAKIGRTLETANVFK